MRVKLKDGREAWHKRLRDFESFDRITFDVVPRYKTSGLSGDEWRQHVEIGFWFKGEKVHSAGYRDMEAALMFVGSEFVKAQEPIPDRVIALEDSGSCDQPSCAAPSIGRLLIKQEFGRQGERLHPDEGKYCASYRQFCAKHIRRGDCSREDSDDNYEPLDSANAAGSTNTETSPAVLAGSIVIADIDELPEAIEKVRRGDGQ